MISRRRRQVFKAAVGLGPTRRQVKDLFDLVRPCVLQGELVRVGGEGDGGYLVPDDLTELAAVVSPGVGPSSSFEMEFAQKGIDCFLFDGSVESPPERHERLHFYQKMVGPEEKPAETTLNTIVEDLCPDTGDLLLQMDIEGAEWSSLEAVHPETFRRFRIAIIEFHNLGEIVTDRKKTLSAITLLRKIRKSHESIHFHPNNCGGARSFGDLRFPNVFEATFLRSERGARRELFAEIPHFLDEESCSRAKPGVNPSWWH